METEKSISEYRIYAEKFWEEINHVFTIKRSKYDYVPIVFVDSQEANVSSNVFGVTKSHINEKTNRNSIFPIVFLHKNRTKEQIKETIRHEIIHYYLGLYYQNYSDDTILFHTVATLFDAGVYKQLEKVQEILKDVALEYLQKTYDLLLKNNYKASIVINLSMMLSCIDDADSGNLDVNKLKSSLALLYKTSVLL